MRSYCGRLQSRLAALPHRKKSSTCHLQHACGSSWRGALPVICSLALATLCISNLPPKKALADHAGDLKRLTERSHAIDQKIGGLGLVLGSGVSKDSVFKSPNSDEGPAPILKTHSTLSGLRAPAGKILSGRILTRLVVGAEPTPVIVEINAGESLFAGLKALGKARQGSPQDRLFIDLDRLVFRTGRNVPLKAVALDQVGAYGLAAQVFSSKALMVAGAMASSFISGLAASQQTQTTTPFGFTQTQPTGRNAVLQGVAQTAADQSKRLIEESTQEKPVLVVEQGTSLLIYLDEEVRF